MIILTTSNLPEKDSQQAMPLFIFYELSIRLMIAEIPLSESSFQTFQSDLIW